MMRHPAQRQSGASLIEVLVSILILSFGMLALSGMLGYAVQMPKLSAYRATAVALASAHVERMRANPAGFENGQYVEANTYPQNSPPTATECSYPNCDATSIATGDKQNSNNAIFHQLPQGGMRVQCDGNCNLKQGDIWVIWDEPSTFAALSNSNDECPAGIFAAGQAPRCIHLKFKL